MDLIKAINLNLNNGSTEILKEGNFRILEGGKYGLIGPNGAGKTSLIRLLLGELEAEGGQLIKKPSLKVGFLPQQPQFDKDDRIDSFLLSDLSPLQKEMTLLESRMAELSSEPAALERLLGRYQRVCEAFEAAGGYNAPEHGATLLGQLGLDLPLDRLLGTLSGGERSMVFFAKALLGRPELLILDEPGNHLDYLGLAWLESFLAGYPGAVLIVSHNRYLLEKTCPELMEIGRGRLRGYRGSYTSYKKDKYRRALEEQAQWEASRRTQETLKKRIKELQSIAMSQYNPPASVMVQLGAAQAKLETEQGRNLEKPVIGENVLNLDFGDELSRSHIALQVKDFDWSYGENEIFKGACLEIHCGERVALVGPNGCGKSTFLKELIGSGGWENLCLRLGPSQRVGYLSQVPVFHSEARTIEDEVRSWGALSKDGAFAVVKHFAFSYGDMDKSLQVLSGGEVNRLQLARLMYERCNFLILDEPTNHMDIPARETIEEALSRFPGTLLVVSHDRYFLDNLVDRVIEIEEKGFRSFEGNFSSYFRSKYPVLPRLSGKISQRGSERKKARGAGPAKGAEELERRIQREEDEKLTLERSLEQAFSEGNRKKGKEAAARLEKLISRLEKLYQEWEALLD